MLIRRMLPVTVPVSLEQTMVEWYADLDKWTIQSNAIIRKRCVYADSHDDAIAAFLFT